MKKTLLFAMALAAVCIMPSCEKEPTKTIAYGNAKGMNLIPYDSIIDNSCIYLDIDNDGVKDFSLDNPYDGFHEANELLGLDDEFSGSQFILFKNDYSFQDSNWYEDGDTVYMYTMTYINHCENFPIDMPFYIGFRSSGQKELLGWFKLILHSVNEGKNVNLELIEIAIQE